MTSFPVKCKHITLSFPYKVKVKGQRSKVGFDPEPASTHLLSPTGADATKQSQCAGLGGTDNPSSNSLLSAHLPSQ